MPVDDDLAATDVAGQGNVPDATPRANGGANGANGIKKEEGAEDTYGNGGEVAGQKRKRYVTVVEGGKKRKVIEIVGAWYIAAVIR
jgi:hypothetical protein